MKHSKHALEKKINKKKLMIVIFIIVVITLVSLLYFISLRKKQPVEMPVPIEENIVEQEPTNEVTEQVQEAFETVDTSDMPTSKGGYGVLGRIVIDKIGVDNLILEKYTNASLNLDVTWLWGPDENNHTINEPRKYMSNRS